jgi:hypothetical protein
MDSTKGGFLLGAGLFFLIFFSSCLIVTQAYYKPLYGELKKYNSSLFQVYQLTRTLNPQEISENYGKIIELLDLFNDSRGVYQTFGAVVVQFDDIVSSEDELEGFKNNLDWLYEHYTNLYYDLMELENEVNLFLAEYGLSEIPEPDIVIEYVEISRKILNLISYETIVDLQDILENYVEFISEEEGSIIQDIISFTDAMTPERLEEYLEQFKDAIEMAYEAEKTILIYNPMKISIIMLFGIIFSSILIGLGVRYVYGKEQVIPDDTDKNGPVEEPEEQVQLEDLAKSNKANQHDQKNDTEYIG